MKKRPFTWFLRLLFYIVLDAVTGAIIYIISIDEADLAPGQLAIRILTAMTLVSAIVGGPDIMLYWQESGRRIAAEEERDAERDGRIAAEKMVATERDARIAVEQERDAVERERDTAVANVAAMMQRVDELSAQVAQLRNERTSRRSRRRHLRRNGP